MITKAAPNQHWFLNSVTGWGTLAGLEPAADNSLVLDGLPGRGSLYQPAIDATICCAAAVTCDDCGRLLILDTRCDRVVRIETPDQIRPIMDFGGKGNRPRQFNSPRGIARRHDGALLISDTGNHRVQIFSAAPYALLDVLTLPDERAGDPRQFRPWGIAVDRCGNAFVVDRGNHRVQQYAKDGTWVRCFDAGAGSDPSEIAVGKGDVVAVVAGAGSAAGGRVLIFQPSSPGSPQVVAALNVATDPTGLNSPAVTVRSTLTASAADQQSGAINQPLRACAVAFDDQGRLFVAAATGVIHRLDPDPAHPGQYVFIGAGVSGLGAPVNMAWQSDAGLLAVVPDLTAGLRNLFQIPTATSYVAEGTLLTRVLDSGINGCVWDRIKLNVILPYGTSIQVDYFTSAETSSAITDSNSTNSYTFQSTEPDPDQTPAPPPPVARQLTCLVAADPNRYLQVRLTFRSDTRSTPSLCWASIYFPRDSYLQYLPAVFQQDPVARDFLDRFLAIFKETFDGFDAVIDGISAMLDPTSVPEQYLQWLAAWIDFQFDAGWDTTKRRRMLKNATKSYAVKGTAVGIVQAVKDSLESTDDPLCSEQVNKAYRRFAKPRIVEHYRLRKWPILRATSLSGDQGTAQARLWSRDFYQRLQVGRYSTVGNFLLTDRPVPAAESPDWGANEFTLFFSTHPLRAAHAVKQIRAILEREKPAHTKANVAAVLPRLRIGVQSTIGVDTCVGACTPLVLGVISRLGYDAVLAPSAEHRDIEQLGASPRPVIGLNTRLI